MECSVVIPAYNEGANIERFVTEFVDRLPRSTLDLTRLSGHLNGLDGSSRREVDHGTEAASV